MTSPAGESLLPFGNGRSYGDSCLNDGGILLDTCALDRLILFDSERGILRCEAGTLLSDLLPLIVAKGWFLPVSPGTKFITIGGAIANDVHGKNHHRAGSFGCHVRQLELLRSDGSRILCSPKENANWFGATVGGLGLTGLITWAEIQLKPVNGWWIDAETLRFRNLDEFFDLAARSDQDYEYTVAWVDCMAKGAALGRGIFIRGNHSTSARPAGAAEPGFLRVPFYLPSSMLNRLSISAFNYAHYHKHLQKTVRKTMHLEKFFYPLDSIRDWNKAYGRRGFFQYQCVVPQQDGPSAMLKILERTSLAGEGSFLGILKLFGDQPSPGLMSFPRPGVTFSLDFPNHGEKTFALLEGIDEIVRQAGGAVYPAKDARMSAESFQAYFPQWKSLREFIDPKFSSSFWRRVTAEKHNEENLDRRSYLEHRPTGSQDLGLQ